MAGQMLLRMPVSLEGDMLEWALVDARGALQGEVQRGDDAAAAEAARGRALSVVASGVDAQLTGAKVPGRNRSRAQAAVPFALEEGLVEDVGAYHFVCGRADADSVYPVVVVPRAFMRDLLARLGAVGLQPARVVSESQLLGGDGTWSVLISDRRAIVRLGPARGFSTEIDALGLLLDAARAELADDPGVVSLRVHGEVPPEILLPGFEIQQQAPAPALEVLARGLAASTNLLQGEFGHNTHLTRVLRAYRPSAVLAAALLLLVTAAGVLEYRQLQQENQRLREEIETVFRQAFPQVRRVVNPRAQMQQRLLDLRGNAQERTGFLQLLAAAAESVARLSDVRLQSLTYRRGRLELDLEAQQLQSLDALQRDIASREGINASLESAKSDQERVRGRLRIVSGDAS